MRVGKSIMDIVEEREKTKENLNRCLNTLVCPRCGYDLTVGISSNGKKELFVCISSACTFSAERVISEKT